MGRADMAKAMMVRFSPIMRTGHLLALIECEKAVQSILMLLSEGSYER
jgi:hypothetical protein